MAFLPGEIVSAFRSRFQSDREPEIYRAPGRVNLIGEHTDYNLGFVFPIALEMACYVAIAPATHNRLRIYSRDFDQDFEISVENLQAAKATGQWNDYAIGVAQELVSAGVELDSTDLYIASEVPVGSGLSSSAALEISTAFALLGSRKMPPLEIAQLGQRAETQFVGVPCGIMDQYTSVFGRKGSAIQIDCRSL